MSNQLYINGKPATLFQRILAAILGVGALVFFAFFGLIVFVIGLAITLVLGLFFWWKTRKIRRHINEEMMRAKASAGADNAGFTNQSAEQNAKSGMKSGNLYEGEYKEL